MNSEITAQKLWILSQYIYPLDQVPDPVALFPLNGAYGTDEINGRVSQGIPSEVNRAAGPKGQADGSYEFYGTGSYIEFTNSAGEALDVRHSMTMLCWLYYGGQDGPIFDYEGNGSSWGVHLWLSAGQLYVDFKHRDYSDSNILEHTTLGSVWRFVGTSYDQTSGEAKLWVDGVEALTSNIGAGLELATDSNIRMGARIGDARYFKGRIAQMQVYNVALTQDDIQQIHNQVTGEIVSTGHFIQFLEKQLLKTSV